VAGQPDVRVLDLPGVNSTAEAQLLAMSKKDIEDRTQGKPAMPEDVIKHFSKSELRDLVECLAGLK
jgi:hypothetical protein